MRVRSSASIKFERTDEHISCVEGIISALSENYTVEVVVDAHTEKESVAAQGKNRMCSVIATLVILAVGCKSAPSSAKPAPPYPNGLTASEVFNLRTKCAEMVDKQSATLGLVGPALTSQVTSHYNPDMNRCYAEVVSTKNLSYEYKAHPVPDNYRTTSVYDAQTKQQLVFADQEGEKSHAFDWTSKTDHYISYEQGLARINQLMQDDAQ